MNKVYDHKKVEKNKNKKWIEKGYFSKHDKKKKPFSILLPPPNVTGKLHIGHAWNTTLQDFLIRFKRMQGYDVLWLPGMDHAGIATQAKVEQKLRDNQFDTNSLTKKFLFDKAMEWKAEYATEIRKQWWKLGLALDYTNERFTLDKVSSEAVNEVFIKFYEEGFIYKGNRAIYYDTLLQTSLSNIEVVKIEQETKMFYLKYFLENSESEYVLVATTRPETLASDVALVYNPKDHKYKKYLGKRFVNPLTKNLIKMFEDEYAIPDFGTGIVKISAHDINDFEIIKKLNLEIHESIDKYGKMNNLAKGFEGMDRFEARNKIIEKLQKENLVKKIENIKTNVNFSERSNTVVEILVMSQWFIKMENFSKMILDKINNSSKSKNKVVFYPERFENILKIWMEKVHDWNISRQLWWGHKIPAWYDLEGNVKVQVLSPGENWKQEEDVLDTWFSSGIAPFSFLNWPKKNEMLERYYPSSVIVTAYDIIFFWVARMYFMGLKVMKNIPFENALIHGLIRDEKGRKMSKSLGNGIDPMDLIEEYGADSLRWFLMTNSTPGQDIRFSHEKMRSSWSLVNKIWNISRYILMLENNNKSNFSLDVESYANSWILNKFNNLKKLIFEKTETYEFSILGKEIYKFINDDFSSSYIELVKGTSTKEFISQIWSNFLILLHPFLPFVTDHLFFELNGKELLESDFFKLEAKKDFLIIDDIFEVVAKIREYRTKFNLSHNIPIEYNLSLKSQKNFQLKKDLIKKLANTIFIEKGDLFFQLKNQELRIKVPKEIKKLEEKIKFKRIEFLQNEIKRASNILQNQNFIKKASAIKIEEEKQKLDKFEKELEKLGKTVKK